MKTKLGAPKLVYGVGINDADYVVQKCETVGYVNGKRKRRVVWVCPYYQAWTSMLTRCYSSKFQERQPTYKGCSVSKDWIRFSNFKRWMECQDFEGKQLDKDLLLEGNKVYSADNCVFVTRVVNNFTIDSGASRGECLIGVNWDKRYGKFLSKCSNPFTKKHEHLGYFTCELEAHQAWLKRKLELAYLLATEQTDERVAKALIERYTNYTNLGGSNGIFFTIPSDKCWQGGCTSEDVWCNFYPSCCGACCRSASGNTIFC